MSTANETDPTLCTRYMNCAPFCSIYFLQSCLCSKHNVDHIINDYEHMKSKKCALYTREVNRNRLLMAPMLELSHENLKIIRIIVLCSHLVEKRENFIKIWEISLKIFKYEPNKIKYIGKKSMNLVTVMRNYPN